MEQISPSFRLELLVLYQNQEKELPVLENMLVLKADPIMGFRQRLIEWVDYSM
jgi:hypothetical protein